MSQEESGRVERSGRSDVLAQEPKGYLRLHHFNQLVLERRQAFHAAFNGNRDWQALDSLIEQEAAFITLLVAINAYAASAHPEAVRYDRDRFATGSFDEAKAQLTGHTAYALHLSALDDNDVLKLGVGIDDVCKRCHVGKHCTSANLREYVHIPADGAPGNGDTLRGEEEAKTSIIAKLEMVLPGEYGTSWRDGSEYINLIDDSGAAVQSPAPYMLLTMRAARALAAAA